MTDLDIKSDVVLVDDNMAPVAVLEEDAGELREIQARVDALSKYRQEMGRMFQAMSNLSRVADGVEQELADKRRALANKYELEGKGTGQWALDFEKKEFVPLDSSAPVIP